MSHPGPPRERPAAGRSPASRTCAPTPWPSTPASFAEAWKTPAAESLIRPMSFRTCRLPHTVVQLPLQRPRTSPPSSRALLFFVLAVGMKASSLRPSARRWGNAPLAEARGSDHPVKRRSKPAPVEGGRAPSVHVAPAREPGPDEGRASLSAPCGSLADLMESTAPGFSRGFRRLAEPMESTAPGFSQGRVRLAASMGFSSGARSPDRAPRGESQGRVPLTAPRGAKAKGAFRPQAEPFSWATGVDEAGGPAPIEVTSGTTACKTVSATSLRLRPGWRT